MSDITFRTTVMDFQSEWTDSFGLVSGAYEWAIRHLKPGERVIGTRQLQYSNKLDLYKFELRNNPEKGITVECEIPSRCHTVIRINQKQMIVQETGSGEIVEKYYRFMVKGVPTWRLWHRRTYEYHIERDAPATNYNIFLLQCNQIIRELAKHCRRDWLFDLRRAMQLADLRGDTPSALYPFLEELKTVVEDLLQQEGTSNAQYQKHYKTVFDWTVTYIQSHDGGYAR